MKFQAQENTVMFFMDKERSVTYNYTELRPEVFLNVCAIALDDKMTNVERITAYLEMGTLAVDNCCRIKGNVVIFDIDECDEMPDFLRSFSLQVMIDKNILGTLNEDEITGRTISVSDILVEGKFVDRVCKYNTEEARLVLGVYKEKTDEELYNIFLKRLREKYTGRANSVAEIVNSIKLDVIKDLIEWSSINVIKYFVNSKISQKESIVSVVMSQDNMLNNFYDSITSDDEDCMRDFGDCLNCGNRR